MEEVRVSAITRKQYALLRGLSAALLVGALTLLVVGTWDFAGWLREARDPLARIQRELALENFRASLADAKYRSEHPMPQGAFSAERQQWLDGLNSARRAVPQPWTWRVQAAGGVDRLAYQLYGPHVYRIRLTIWLLHILPAAAFCLLGVLAWRRSAR